MLQHQRPAPVPPLPYSVQNPLQPQTLPNNDILLAPKAENELQREQQRRDAIAMMAEHTYGPNVKITQAQYDHMVSLVEAQERKLHSNGPRALYEEGRPDGLRQGMTQYRSDNFNRGRSVLQRAYIDVQYEKTPQPLKVCPVSVRSLLHHLLQQSVATTFDTNPRQLSCKWLFAGEGKVASLA
ncbi:MAG: hypothetical protein Q9163_004066 [Psora crenata]